MPARRFQSQPPGKLQLDIQHTRQQDEGFESRSQGHTDAVETDPGKLRL